MLLVQIGEKMLTGQRSLTIRYTLHAISTLFYLGASWGPPMGVEFSCYVEDPFVDFGCCLLFGWVVASLTYSSFSISVLNISSKLYVLPSLKDLRKCAYNESNKVK